MTPKLPDLPADPNAPYHEPALAHLISMTARLRSTPSLVMAETVGCLATSHERVAQIAKSLGSASEERLARMLAAIKDARAAITDAMEVGNV